MEKSITECLFEMVAEDGGDIGFCRHPISYYAKKLHCTRFDVKNAIIELTVSKRIYKRTYYDDGVRRLEMAVFKHKH